jgi:hypothetical protein
MRPMSFQRRALRTGPVRAPGRGERLRRPPLRAPRQSAGKAPSLHGWRHTGPWRPGALSRLAIMGSVRAVRVRHLGGDLDVGECGWRGGASAPACPRDQPGCAARALRLAPLEPPGSAECCPFVKGIRPPSPTRCAEVALTLCCALQLPPHHVGKIAACSPDNGQQLSPFATPSTGGLARCRDQHHALFTSSCHWEV